MAVIVNGDGILTGISSLATALTDLNTGRGTVTGVATVGTLQLGAGVSISSPRTQTAAIFTNNTEFFTVDDAGRVGVGTITPNSDAHPENEKKINVGFITARSIAGDIDANTMVTVGIATFVDEVQIITDNKRLKFGAGNDLNIYSTGTNGWVFTPQSGADLYMGTNAGEVYIQTGSSGNDTAIKVNSGGAVELYHNNSKKLETVSTGTQVVGDLTFSSATSKAIRLNDNKRIYFGDDEDFWIGSNGSNGEVSGSLFYYNHQYHYDNVYARFGNGTDLNIFHNGTNSFISNTTGILQIDSDDRVQVNATEFRVKNAGDTELIAKFIQDGACELYHNNEKKIETTSTGSQGTGIVKLISGNGSQSSDFSLLHLVAGGTADRGLKIGTGRATGANQNDGAVFYDAINSESNEYGSQHIFRRGGHNNMVIGYQSNNYVGINNDYPDYELSVKATDTNESTIQILAGGNGKESNLLFGAPDDADVGAIKYDHNGDHMKFIVGTSEKFRVNSHGLCIGGTGSANALDDYEEGTWTPGFYPMSSAMTISYDLQTGTYRKIGNVVFWAFRVRLSALSGQMGQNMGFSGFPFNVDQSQPQFSSNIYGENYSGEKPTGIFYQGNLNRGDLYYPTGNGAYANLQAGDLNPSNSYTVGTGFYFAA